MTRRAIPARELSKRLQDALARELGEQVRGALASSASAEGVGKAGRARVKPEAPRARVPSTLAWSCHACGTVSTSWAAAQRHADGDGHARIDLVYRAGKGA